MQNIVIAAYIKIKNNMVFKCRKRYSICNDKEDLILPKISNIN